MSDNKISAETEKACNEGAARNIRLTGQLERAIKRITVDQAEEDVLGEHNIEFMHIMNKLNDNMEMMVRNVNGFMVDDFMWLMLKLYLLSLDEEHNNPEYVLSVMRSNIEGAYKEINDKNEWIEWDKK